MASLKLIGDTYFVLFRIGGRNGKQFQRSLGTDLDEAEARKKRIEATLHDIRTGRIKLPEDADAALFVLSDGQVTTKPTAPTFVTLRQGFDRYLESSAYQKKAPTTQITEKAHTRTICRLLKKTTPIVTLTSKDLQRYIDMRKNDKGIRGENVQPRTIQKELATLSVIWNDFFKPQGIVGVRFNVRFDDNLSYEKDSDKPDFDTYGNIARKIARGGLSESEILDLWDCLYLNEEQVNEILAIIKSHPDSPPWLYPAAIAVAHTGCRRSEMMRSEIDDFDFESGIVRWREKKKNHKKKFTFRHVTMSSLVRQTMEELKARHVVGQLAFCVNPGERLTPKVVYDALNIALRGTKWDVIRGWHIFRHSYASIMASRGVDQRLIDADLGHQTEEMRKRYQQLFPKYRQQAHHAVFG